MLRIEYYFLISGNTAGQNNIQYSMLNVQFSGCAGLFRFYSAMGIPSKSADLCSFIPLNHRLCETNWY
jgi:hypothetical protein